MTALLPRSSRRPSLAVLRFLLVAVAVAVVAVLFQWWSLLAAARRGQDDLDRVLAALDRDDPRWRWNDLEADRPTVPDAENSWRVIERIPECDFPLRARHFAYLDTMSFFTESSGANRLLCGPVLDDLAQVLADNEPGLRLARSVQALPCGRVPLTIAPDVVSTAANHGDKIRLAAWLLDLDGEYCLAHGRAHEAAQRITALLHVGAALRGEGLQQAQQVRLVRRERAVRRVERLLGLAEPDEATLVGLQEHLAREAGEDLLGVGLRGERALFALLCDALRSERVKLERVLRLTRAGWQRDDTGWGWLSGFLYSYHLADDQAALLRCYTQAVALAGLPAHEQPAAWRELEVEAQVAQLPPAPRHLLAGLLPPLGRLVRGTLRDRALLGCAQAALAAERFRRARGRWPESLAELVPAYLPGVPADPFTGQPLLLATSGQGLVIYSVGGDGSDDGGQTLAPRPRELLGTDLGVQLWDPPARRLPPPPGFEPPDRPLHEVAP